MRIRGAFRRVKYGQKPVTQVDVQHTSGGIQLKHPSHRIVLSWDTGWVQRNVPEYILQKLPRDIKDDTQRNWTALIQEFVADIRGETHKPYQTFYDGWLYQLINESIRLDS